MGTIICEFGNTQYTIKDLYKLDLYTKNNIIGIIDLRVLLEYYNNKSLINDSYGHLTSQIFNETNDVLNVIDLIINERLKIKE